MLKTLNYQHLVYCWTVARERSITRATGVRHLMQPTIGPTRLVAEVEDVAKTWRSCSSSDRKAWSCSPRATACLPNSLRDRCDGQREPELTPMPGLTSDADLAAVRLDDAFRDVQSEA